MENNIEKPKEIAATFGAHTCRDIENLDSVWFSKIKSEGETNWFLNMEDEDGNVQFFCVKYCPYCGKQLED